MLKKIIQNCVIVCSLLCAHSSFAACTANIDMGDKKIIDLAEPTNAKDATTKQYVDMSSWQAATDVSGIGGRKNYSYDSSNGIFCIYINANNVSGAVLTHNKPLANFNLPVTPDHNIYIPAFEDGLAARLWLKTDGELLWLASDGNQTFGRHTSPVLHAEGCYNLNP